ncbi:MAG: hypothetical protein JWR75_404 [Devosia sp.]|nr:hypothetical protein [Devosia sp.]
MHYETRKAGGVKREDKPVLDAVALADLCLQYLAENPEELANFMGYGGYDPEGLRRSVGSPQLRAGLLDYVAENEPILLAVCANAAISPESFMRIWHRLNRTL